MTETKVVQMRFRESTFVQIEDLKRLLNTNNRTSIVVFGLELLHSLQTQISAGSKVLVKDKDGTVRELLIIRK